VLIHSMKSANEKESVYGSEEVLRRRLHFFVVCVRKRRKGTARLAESR
jgi:hypothetical protein